MKILIATHNPSKFERYRNLLHEFTNIEFLSLGDIGIIQKVEEPFSLAKENAIYKAKEYAALSHLPTLAVDEAVQTNFLPEKEQPGVYVRRFANKGNELGDEEILQVWKDIFQKYPQKDKQFTWDFSVAFYNPISQKPYSITVASTSSVVDIFSTQRQKGYPMSSFLVPKGKDRPYVELTAEEKLEVDTKAFSKFIKEFPQWIKDVS